MRRLLIVPLLLAATASPASAWTKDCAVQATGTTFISSARNMSCEKAAKVMASHQGSISRHFTTTRYGFDCTRVSGGRLAGQWRCTHGKRAFRFEFAD